MQVYIWLVAKRVTLWNTLCPSPFPLPPQKNDLSHPCNLFYVLRGHFGEKKWRFHLTWVRGCRQSHWMGGRGVVTYLDGLSFATKDSFSCHIKYTMNVSLFVYNYFIRWKIKCSTQLSLASLNGTFRSLRSELLYHYSHERSCNIHQLILIDYLYVIVFVDSWKAFLSLHFVCSC